MDSPSNYAIDRGPADKSLLEYARQSRDVRVSVLFPSEVLSQYTTNDLHGRYRADEALDRLLRGTGLSGSITAEGLVIIAQPEPRGENMKKKSLLGWIGGLLGFSLSHVVAPLAAISASPVASAQAAAPVAQGAAIASEEQALEEVVITGSRILRPGFTSPTPVTSIDGSVIEQAGQINVANVLNDIPAFRPTVTEQSAAQAPSQVGTNYADLRGLGSLRTLVLMNGERFVPQIGILSPTTSNQVDLNVFPSIAIQRVDVVTGGASSAWGSDAVAGVVNLQMYRRYDGIKADYHYGISSRNDNKESAAQLLAGSSFFGNRAHVVVATAWSKNSGVGDQTTRPWWGGDYAYTMRDTARCSTCWLSGHQWQLITAAPGGVIVSSTGGSTSALNNIAFGVGGTPYNMPQGTFRSGTDGVFGGTVPNNYDGYLVPLKAPSQRTNTYANLDVDFTDRLTGHLTVNYSDRHARNYSNSYLITYTILSGNPFIPPSIQAQMTARNITSIRVGVKHNDILTPPDGPNGYQNNGRTARISAGFDWRLGGSWRLASYFTYGDNHNQNYLPRARNFVNAAQAADAILVNGVIQCRNPANGCVPINIFGPGSASDAALQFITSPQDLRVNAYQRAAAVNLNGEPFGTWAGPVSVAAGVEYREESKRDYSDALTRSGALNSSGATTPDFSGKLEVKEAYLETVVPLVKDVPAVRSLDLNAAIRGTDYSTLGRFNTWKVGAVWHLTDPLLFRGTVSRDIRAPTITELYAPQTRTSSTSVPGQLTPVDFFTGGNPGLQAETADSTLFGVTLRRTERFGATLDFYDVRIKNVIFNANASAVVNACIAGNAIACSQEIHDPNNPSVITRVIGGNSNVAELKLRGIDVELFSTLGLGRLPGSINLRAQGTYSDTLSYQTSTGQPFKDYAGQNNRGIVDNSPFWAPRFKGSLSIGYLLAGFTGSLVSNYISSGVNQVGLSTAELAENDIPAYWRFDLNLAYKFGADGRMQLYGNVRNLTDKEPPFLVGNGLDIPTSPLYDTVGRSFIFGLRYSH